LYAYLCFSYYAVHSKPTKKKIQNIVVPKVATCWYELGVELLSEGENQHLDILRLDFSNNNQKCCAEMFWHWMRTDPNASWYKLVQSLKSEAVQLPSVAADIEKMFQG